MINLTKQYLWENVDSLSHDAITKYLIHQFSCDMIQCGVNALIHELIRMKITDKIYNNVLGLKYHCTTHCTK